MPRIITLTCDDCGTIVAGNVLEAHREQKCPGQGCDAVLRFEDLPRDERQHILDNPEQYAMTPDQ